MYLDPNTCAVNVVPRSSLYILMRLPDNFKKIHCGRILCDAVKIPLHLSIFLGKISVLIFFKCSSWPQTRALNRVVQVVVARKCFMPVHKHSFICFHIYSYANCWPQMPFQPTHYSRWDYGYALLKEAGIYDSAGKPVKQREVILYFYCQLFLSVLI